MGDAPTNKVSLDFENGELITPHVTFEVVVKTCTKCGKVVKEANLVD